VSIEGGAALHSIKENVTAEEPKCRTGNLGGVPKYTLDTVLEQFSTVSFWEKHYEIFILR
jgi:hypothetical protein